MNNTKPQTAHFTGAERRGMKRMLLTQAMLFRPLDSDHGAEYLNAEIVDFSLSGLRFRAGIAMRPGERIRLHIRTHEILNRDPTARTHADALAEFIATAEIVRVEPSIMGGHVFGVRFVTLHQGTINALYDFIDRFA